MSADSYHKYKEDVQLAADMGVGVYRVSVAWSRIVPEGLGAVSPEVGLQDSLLVLQNRWEGTCLLKFAITHTSTVTSILGLEKKR